MVVVVDVSVVRIESRKHKRGKNRGRKQLMLMLTSAGGSPFTLTCIKASYGNHIIIILSIIILSFTRSLGAPPGPNF